MPNRPIRRSQRAWPRRLRRALKTATTVIARHFPRCLAAQLLELRPLNPRDPGGSPVRPPTTIYVKVLGLLTRIVP